MITKPTYPRIKYPFNKRYLKRSEANTDYPTMEYINRVAKEPILLGQVSSGTINSFTDETAEWQINQYVDKVVKLQKQGGTDYCYGVVKSNTSNTITLDHDLLMIPCSECEYKIIDTLVLTVADLNKIIAIDNFNYDLGVVLPKVTTAIERKIFHIYIERSNNGNNNVIIMGRLTDYQLGAKYGTLTYNGEGVTIYAHSWNSLLDQEANRYHWDIVNLQGIQRLGSGYWSDDEQIISETLIPIGENLTIDIERKFYAELNCTIEKTGGAGEAEISIGVYDPIADEIIVGERSSLTRFGSGVGFTTISVKTPILLKRNYEVVALACTTGTNFFIKQRSTLDVYEV